MSAFQKMLDSVRASNPDLITEQQAAQLNQEFDAEMDQIKADATADGRAAGFRQGYQEGKKAAADEAKVKLDQVVQKLDTESTQKLTRILEMLDSEHADKLSEVETFLREKYEQEKADALEAQDADYAEKFSIAMQAIKRKDAHILKESIDRLDKQHSDKLVNMYNALDKKHAAMITEAVDAVDRSNAAKLQELAGLYAENKQKAVRLATESVMKKMKKELKKQRLVMESKLDRKDKAMNAEREHKLDMVAESVEKYLNYALDQHIPQRQLISEAKYNAALKTIQKVTDVLKVNAIVQESKDGIFADYEAKIAEQTAEQQKLIKQNVQLKANLDKKEAQIVLEEKCRQCTPSEAKFVRTYFRNAASPSVIEESINEARNAFRKLQSEKRQALIDEAAKKTVATPEKKVAAEQKAAPAKQESKKIVSEQKAEQPRPARTQPTSQTSLVDIYARMLRGDK